MIVHYFRQWKCSSGWNIRINCQTLVVNLEANRMFVADLCVKQKVSINFSSSQHSGMTLHSIYSSCLHTAYFMLHTAYFMLQLCERWWTVILEQKYHAPYQEQIHNWNVGTYKRTTLPPPFPSVSLPFSFSASTFCPFLIQIFSTYLPFMLCLLSSSLSPLFPPD